MKKSTTRKETAARKEALSAELRAVGRSGKCVPGETMVSVRELASKYGLAIQTVSLELQKLAEAGVLYTIPRVGTFIGRPDGGRENVFVAVFPYLDRDNVQFAAIRSGFEERIARLGGASLVLDFELAKHYRDAENGVQPAGIFEFHEQIHPPVWCVPGTAHAGFGEISVARPDSDMVYFDNIGGGRQAAQHLIGLGHQQIAFLGVHAPEGDPGFFLWSKEREEGWRQSLSEAGLDTQEMAFHPSTTPSVAPADIASKARQSAEKLLCHPEITGIVIVNAIATQALFQVLRGNNRPVDRWPAIVSFDSEVISQSDTAMHLVSAFRLPWEEIGREGADLLWNRSQGRVSDAPQQRYIPMSLIPRLSCRQQWHRAPETASQREKWVPAVS